MKALTLRSMSGKKNNVLTPHRREMSQQINASLSPQPPNTALISSQNRITTSQNKPSLRSLRSLLLMLLLIAPCLSSVVHGQQTAVQPCYDGAAKKQSTAGTKTTVTQTLVDATIPEDPTLMKLIEPYSVKVRALENVIGKLEGDLKKAPVGGGTLGNFVTDSLRAAATQKLSYTVPLLIANTGGMRKSAIAAGDLKAKDIFELLPFENELIEIDLTGDQLLKLLEVVLTERDAQSGARIKYSIDADQKLHFLGATLINSAGQELPIDPKATYRIVTIDYLYKLASGSYSILQEGKNVRPVGTTMRDAVMQYVQSETAAGRSIKPSMDQRFLEEGKAETKGAAQP